MIRSSRSARCWWGRPTKKSWNKNHTKQRIFFGPLDLFLGGHSIHSMPPFLVGSKFLMQMLRWQFFLREFAFWIRAFWVGLVIFPDPGNLLLGIFPIQKLKKNLQDVTSMVGFDNAKVVSARSVASTLAFWVDGWWRSGNFNSYLHMAIENHHFLKRRYIFRWWFSTIMLVFGGVFEIIWILQECC